MKLRAIVVTGVLVSLFACGDPAEPPVPSSLRAVSGDHQVVTVGEPLGSPLIVEVTDQRGRAMEGVAVRWSATAGALSASTVETGAGGRAQVSWTLGTAAGEVSATASITGVPAVTFTAEGLAGPATTLELSAPTNAVAGESVTMTLTARDAHDNIATGYEGEKSLVFSGASAAPDATPATVEDRAGSATTFGSATALDFAEGWTRATAVLYAAEVAMLDVTDGVLTSEAMPVTVAGGPAAALALSPAADTIFATFSLPLLAELRDNWENPTTASLTWTSSGAAASVDGDGVVTGVDSGSVTITATVGQLEASARIEVDRFIAIRAGAAHTCAVTSTGAGYCWGDNAHGELGDGTVEQSSVPRLVSGGHVWARLTPAANHTCGLTRVGEIYCWGDNVRGQLGTGNVQASTVPAPLYGGGTWVSVQAGGMATCAVADTGDGYCWGAGGHRQLGDGGSDDQVAPVLVTGGHSWSEIRAGFVTSCGVASGEAGYCWGSGDYYGQLGDGSWERKATPSAISGGMAWRHIDLGWWHSCGLDADGQIFCWGSDEFGQLGDGPLTTGSDVPSPVQGAQEWAMVTAGALHTCAVTSAGEAFCWGRGVFGQLGNGTPTEVLVPSLVSGGHVWSAVDAGSEHTCGLTTDGAPYCWGENSKGQITGDGRSSVPVKITPP